MKVTGEIRRLLDRRERYADRLMASDAEVHRWLKSHGIETPELDTEYACMLTAEPGQYKDMTLTAIAEA